MNTMTKQMKIILSLIALFIVIQFIRPAKNSSTTQTGQTIADVFPVSDTVRHILTTSCFNCHSNNTRYPWYASVEPVGWYLNDHIQDGKHDLNFDEFGTYVPRRQYGKLRQIQRQIKEDEMPLPSYLLIHRDAVLSAGQKTILLTWASSLMDTLKAHHPLDSLEWRRRRPIQTNSKEDK